MSVIEVEVELVTARHTIRDQDKKLAENIETIKSLTETIEQQKELNNNLQKEVTDLKEQIKTYAQFTPVYG